MSMYDNHRYFLRRNHDNQKIREEVRYRPWYVCFDLRFQNILQQRKYQTQRAQWRSAEKKEKKIQWCERRDIRLCIFHAKANEREF